MFDTWRAWEEDVSVSGKWAPVIENFEGNIIECRTDSDSGDLRRIPREDGDIFICSPLGIQSWRQNGSASHIAEEEVHYDVKYEKPKLVLWN